MHTVIIDFKTKGSDSGLNRFLRLRSFVPDPYVFFVNFVISVILDGLGPFRWKLDEQIELSEGFSTMS